MRFYLIVTSFFIEVDSEAEVSIEDLSTDFDFFFGFGFLTDSLSGGLKLKQTKLVDESTRDSTAVVVASLSTWFKR